MNALAEKSGPRPPENFPLREMFQQMNILRTTIENDVANRLCVPLYELTEKPSDVPPDDTLRHLERLIYRQREFNKRLIGAIYRLDLSGNQLLVILTDGTVMKISADNLDPDKLNEFRRNILNQEELADPNLFLRIKKNPLVLTLFLGQLVYRTDDPLLSPDEVKKLVSEDWKRANEIKNEFSLQQRLLENQRAALEILTSSQDNPNSTREETKE